MALSSMSEGFEPMQVDANSEENDNDVDDGRVILGIAGNGVGPHSGSQARGSLLGDDGNLCYNVTNPCIDLEAYAQGYSGLARLYRLRFIAHHCPVLRVEALKLAISYVLNTHNTPLFAELHRKLAAAMADSTSNHLSGAANNLPDVAASSGVPSSSSSGELMTPTAYREWIETKNKKAALKLEKLDTDLKNYKSNSIKESIRRGHDDLGDHFLDCGDLANALKCYSRARDYCTSGRHVVNMCVNVIKVSVHLQNWSHVISYVNKALATPDFAEGTMKGVDHANILTCLHCSHGLAELATRKYKSAAKRFLMAQLDNCNIPEIMSAQNVATYGGLCALATFDRSQLQKQVIGSQSFKLFLELDPQLREVILCFYESKYGKCLSLLEEMKDNLLLDVYLAGHVHSLYSLIRNRSLIQYFSPYLSADLRLMASSFNTTVNSLEDELMSLILDGKIQARIDSHNKVLYAQDIDLRSATFEKALEMATLHQRRVRMTILRSAILKNNIFIKNQQNRSDHGDGNN